MDVEVIIGEPWQHILRAIRREEGRTTAAIAYVTKELLDLRRGDVLVCDASELSVKTCQTDPDVLLAYLRKGVSIRSYPGLHAKAIVRGRVAVVGSANSSNASADGQLAELVTITTGRPAAAAVRARIEILARRSVALDPITLNRLARLFNPRKEFQPRGPSKKAARDKTRAWCIGTHYVNEHADLAQARRRGSAAAEKSAQSRLGKRWRGTYRIDDDISWFASTSNKFELGDSIFEIVEEKMLRPPGILVHKESSAGRHGSVLFICRERKQRTRQMKKVRGHTDRKTYNLVRKANLRQLSPQQLDKVNEIFGV
jgi:hypothetical protein